MMYRQLSVMSAMSSVIMLGCRRLRRKSLVQRVVWIVHSFAKQLIVTLLQLSNEKVP